MKRTRKSEVEPLSAAAGENHPVISLSCHVVGYFNPHFGVFSAGPVSSAAESAPSEAARLQCDSAVSDSAGNTAACWSNQTPSICRVELFDLKQLKSFYQPLFTVL